MLHWVLSWTGSARALPVSMFGLWQECFGKKRHQDQCGILSVTSKSNFLVGSVTENLVGTESAQLTLVPPTSINIQNWFSRCSSRPGRRRGIGSSLFVVQLHALWVSTLPLEGKSPCSVFPLMGRGMLLYPEASWKTH